jgi:hypothetical protein
MLRCRKCSYEWHVRISTTPKACPKCKSKWWNTTPRSECPSCSSCPNCNPKAHTTTHTECDCYGEHDRNNRECGLNTRKDIS